jgi:hypothetical protein
MTTTSTAGSSCRALEPAQAQAPRLGALRPHRPRGWTSLTALSPWVGAVPRRGWCHLATGPHIPHHLCPVRAVGNAGFAAGALHSWPASLFSVCFAALTLRAAGVLLCTGGARVVHRARAEDDIQAPVESTLRDIRDENSAEGALPLRTQVCSQCP